MNELGKNIKRLRRNADLTQEQLGDMLGVAYQTVSKWELGITFPDISMIAPIARLFKVSADELLGLSESADEAKRRELEERYWKTYTTGDVMEKYEVAKLLVKEFPGDYKYLDWLADAEWLYAEHHCEWGSEEDKEHQEAAIKYYKMVIENCDDDVWREDAIDGIVMNLPDLGRYEEAVQYANMSRNKDDLLKWCLTGEDWEIHHQKMIQKKLGDLVFELEFGHHRLQNIKAAESVIKAVVDDENYVAYHSALMHNYIWQAAIYAKNGQADEAIAYLKKSHEHAVKYDEVFAKAWITPVPYTCSILDKSFFGPADNMCRTGTSTITEDFQTYLERKSFDSLRENEEFIKLKALPVYHEGDL